MGFIKLYIGCMYSGKTTEIIRECHRCNSIGKNVLCINYSFDNRYGDDDFVYSHTRDKISCVKSVNLADVDQERIRSADVIMINEGQFFADLIEHCVEWCEKLDKDVLVSGLSGDFQRKSFGQILELIPLADEVMYMTAYCVKCRDGTIANFTWRLSTETEQVVIGSDNYIPVCRRCYLKLKNEKKNNDK